MGETRQGIWALNRWERAAEMRSTGTRRKQGGLYSPGQPAPVPRGRQPARPPQDPGQVRDRTVEPPFRLDFREAPQPDLATPLDGLEIPNRRLDRTWPPPVPAAAGFGPEIAPHPILPGEMLRDPAAWRLDRPPDPVLQLLRWDRRGDLPFGAPSRFFSLQ